MASGCCMHVLLENNYTDLSKFMFTFMHETLRNKIIYDTTSSVTQNERDSSLKLR